VLHASVWRVPVAGLPATFPPGVRPSLWFGRATLVTAWVTYEPGSVLDYRELMAVVRVRLTAVDPATGRIEFAAEP
jgi:hypothetical protein